MQRQLVLLSCLFGFSSFAALPTINCTENERGIIFEEGIDDFLVDLRDVSSTGTIPGGLTPRIDGQKYLLQLRIPKRTGTEFSAGRPTCQFADEQPLLMSCAGIRPTEKVKLTNIATGEVTEIAASYLTLNTSLNKRESIDFQGKVQTDSTLRFSLQMNYSPLPAPAPPALPTPIDPSTGLPVARPAPTPTPGLSPNPVPVARPGFLRADFDVRQAVCKTGEQAESPAR
jgi:hypothetical protein